MKPIKENNAISDDIIKKHGLKKSEYELIIELLGRDPNINELGMFSVMWSEHCSYKHSKELLSQFPTSGKNIVCGPGENAGVVDVGDGIHIVFKVESHNHPTAVEPFQGATTGVGGILRDIFTMGARPIANMNSLRFGNLNNKRNKYLFSKAVEGIAWYGNCVGVPTIGGECWFDDIFSGNPIVNALCVGIMYEGDLIKAGAVGAGNPVIYVGSDTGRDGMAGAAFASKEITKESIKERPAVQVGDPFKGKLLIESCLEAFKTGYILAAQDMGAAGITCSVSEMASKGNVGISFDLDRIPSRGEDITPYEYLLSESQERMLIVAEKNKENEIIKIFNRWGLNAVVAGEVISQNRIIIKHNNKIVVDIPADALTQKAPIYNLQGINTKTITNKASVINQIEDIKLKDIETIAYKLLESPNICSRRWIFKQYDRQVQNNSILQSEHYSSAVVRLRNKEGEPVNKAIALSMDCNSRLTYIDPYKGAIQAVAESARNVVCAGAKPIAITNNLNFANPKKPENFWQLKEACKGIKNACNAFKISVTGGNVSLYNETDGIPIYPTPVIGMLGIIENYKNVLTPAFKNNDDILVLVGESNNNLDGSEYASYILNKMGSNIPNIDIKRELRLHNFILTANQKQILNSCTDISEGGVLMSIIESSILSNKGVLLVKNILQLTERLDSSLFEESPGRIIATLNKNNINNFEELIKENNLQYNILGKIQSDIIKIDETPVKIDLYKATKLWETALEKKMKS